MSLKKIPDAVAGKYGGDPAAVAQAMAAIRADYERLKVAIDMQFGRHDRHELDKLPKAIAQLRNVVKGLPGNWYEDAPEVPRGSAVESLPDTDLPACLDYILTRLDNYADQRRFRSWKDTRQDGCNQLLVRHLAGLCGSLPKGDLRVHDAGGRCYAGPFVDFLTDALPYFDNRSDNELHQVVQSMAAWYHAHG